jgi:hypothetical protein
LEFRGTISLLSPTNQTEAPQERVIQGELLLGNQPGTTSEWSLRAQERR